MKKNLKKTFAIVMVMALTLTMFSGVAFADGPPKMIKIQTGRFENGAVGIQYGSQYKELGSRDEGWFHVEFTKHRRILDEYTVTALPDSGYKFDEWVDRYSPKSDDAEHVRELRERNEVTPSFNKKKVKKVDLTVYADPAHGGKVEVEHENGTTETVTSGTTVKAVKGEDVTITAIPASGADKYKFVSFGGDVADTDNPTVVKMDSDKEVVANFRPKVLPILEYVVDNGDGTYSAHFGYNVRGGEDVMISVGNQNKLFGGGISGQNAGQPVSFTSGRRYDVFSVEFDGTDLSWKLDGTTVVASVVKSELRFIVRPELFANGDLVVKNMNSGGDVEFNGALFGNGQREIYVPCYTNGLPTKLEFKAVPDSGLEFIEWANKNTTNNPRYITFDKSWLGTKKMVRKPSPVFETGEAILTIVAEEHGSTSISKKIYDVGDIVDISAIAGFITADAGYVFAGFVEASDDFTIYEDTTLTAEFATDEDVTLTILTDGNGVSSLGSIDYEAGSLVDLTDIIALLTPNEGYAFAGFEEYSADFYISADTTITATFEAESQDVPQTGDTSKDLSIAWILAMVLPLLAAAGMLLTRSIKHRR